MSIRSKTLLTLGALFTGALLACAAPSANSVLYFVEEDFTATGLDADASGHVQALVNQKGQRHLQRLRVTVAHLDPHTPYALLAAIGADTNLVAVANFKTSGSGRAVVMQQRKMVRDKIRRTAERHTLAEALAPLAEVHTLAVANTNGEVALTVSLHESPSLQFELTSVFNNTGADYEAVGCVAVAVQSGHLQFRLFAAGQGSQFTLDINDSPVGTYSADYSGRINIGAFPSTAPSPLAFRKLSMRNSEDTIVLESTVP
jgi:hypothetical protein